MRGKLLALSLGIVGANAVAADAPPKPQPLAPGGVIAAAKASGKVHATLVAAPVVMETSVQVLPDGRLGIVCEQKANPHPVAPVSVSKRFPEQQK
jgi:hypothetical protein